MCELYMVHFFSLADMNGNVNERALKQYRVYLRAEVVEAFLAE